MTEKEQEELKEQKEPKEAKEKKEVKGKEEPKEAKEEKEAKGKEEPKEAKEKKESKDKKGPKEKPLDRMTAKELREVALGLEGIVGVHGMNKGELLAAVKKVKGIKDEKKRQTSVDVRSIKRKIRELRSQKEAVKEAGDKKKIKILRRRINRLKKKTRRVAMGG
ncbi:MAG: transcription termination factor Rho [Deltaproteobacteria bacterium]|nr:transcription termination factor Rho [Deltaproteobacteria bacterium]